MTIFPRTWAEVDLGALKHNLAFIRAALPTGVKLALVTKADAYGHGLIPVSRAALRHGADWIAVATVQEGIALREAGIEAPIIVLAPTLELEAEHAVYYRLRSLVESLDAATALSRAAIEQGTMATLHIKIDSGMARFGVQAEDAAALAKEIRKLPGVNLEGAASHFANSARDPEYTKCQYERFQRALCEMKAEGVDIEVRHCANSGALLRFPSAHMDLARIGILAYGISHVPEPGFELRRVLTWKARVMAMRDLPKGANVGYNCAYTTDRACRIATLGVGYGDGYHRGLSNKGEVLLHGKRAPLRGVVCMDQIMVDVTDVPEASVGDEAGLIEGPITAEWLAELVGTTPHEITTRIMSRVPRRYVNAQ